LWTHFFSNSSTNDHQVSPLAWLELDLGVALYPSRACPHPLGLGPRPMHWLDNF
jgi:hypothetical protein